MQAGKGCDSITVGWEFSARSGGPSLQKPSQTLNSKLPLSLQYAQWWSPPSTGPAEGEKSPYASTSQGFKGRASFYLPECLSSQPLPLRIFPHAWHYTCMMNNGMNEYMNRAWVNHFSLRACLTQLEHWFLHLDAQLWALISLREHISFSLLRRTLSLMVWGGKGASQSPLQALPSPWGLTEGDPTPSVGVFRLAHTQAGT